MVQALASALAFSDVDGKVASSAAMSFGGGYPIRPSRAPALTTLPAAA